MCYIFNLYPIENRKVSDRASIRRPNSEGKSRNEASERMQRAASKQQATTLYSFRNSSHPKRTSGIVHT
jgi:hypothetical protein